jgi:hypothetical protein
MSNPTTNNVTPITPKVGRPAGRPKGKRSQLGMSLKNRLKTLRGLIENPATKDSDRVLAVKLMTELLADKMQVEAGKEADTYMIKFEEISNNTLDGDKGAVNVPANVPANMDVKQANTNDEQTSQVLEVPANEGLIEVQDFKPKNNVMLISKTPTRVPVSAISGQISDITEEERKLKQAKARLHKLRAIRDMRVATNNTNTPATDDPNLF